MNSRSISIDIREWIKVEKEQILGLVSDMVGFNTVNKVISGTEKECQIFLQGVMKEIGLETDLYSPEDIPELHSHPAYFPGKDYSQRPNLAGILAGKGKDKGKSLIFSSHIDTAVVAPDWNSDPFKTRIEGNRLYGLGTFDMKGGLAASLMAVKCLKELGIELNGDVMVESVVDEEFGGANGTLAARLRGYQPDAAIIPEPTNMAVCPASKGGALWRVTFRGKTGRSFSGEKIINPAYSAGKFMAFLEEYEQTRTKTTTPPHWYEHDRQLPVDVTRVEAGDLSLPLCDVGPTECHVDIWVECYPGVTEEELKQEIVDGYIAKYGGEAPEFNKVVRFLPGSEVDPEFPLIDLLQKQVEKVTNHAASVHGAPFACDAFMFNLYSRTPAIILGPKGENAHAPEENIEIDAFLQLVEIYAAAIIDWCGIYEQGGHSK